MWENMESLKNGMTKELVKQLQENKPKKRVMYKVGLIVEGFLDKDSEHIIMRFFSYYEMHIYSSSSCYGCYVRYRVEVTRYENNFPM